MAHNSTKRKPKPKPNRSLLPLWLSLAGLVLVAIAAWSLLGRGAPDKTTIEVTGQARLKAEKTVIDHGNVKLGTPVRDDIRVTNVGDQPLRFTEAPYIEVREGC